MRWAKSTAMFLLIGFLINASIAALLGYVDKSWYHPEQYLVGPRIDHIFADHSSHTISATKLTGFGCQRRGWYYDDGYDVFKVGGPFNLSRKPDPYNQHRLFKNSPTFAWSIAGEASWGKLYTTKLETIEDARAFEGFEVAAGFPALSFSHQLTIENDGSATTPGGIRLPDPARMANPAYEVRAIPFRPIWPGIVINSVFYALVVFSVSCLYRIVCEHRRYTKGKCPSCRYNLDANFASGCPECGWRRGGSARSGVSA